MSITSERIAKKTEPKAKDAIETYTTRMGLLDLGGGSWQYGWQVPLSWSGQTRLMTLLLADGSTHSAYFRFQ